MGQVLEGRAGTTEAVGCAIQHCRESLRVLARRYGQFRLCGAAREGEAACRGPLCQPQAGGADHAPARHPGARVTPLSRVPARQQAFSAGRGQAAGADITRIATGEGWLYRAVILDLFARKNLPRRKPGVGWARRQDRRPWLSNGATPRRVASLIRIAAAGMPPETAARSGRPPPSRHPEPHGEPLGQCPEGELLPDPENHARPDIRL